MPGNFTQMLCVFVLCETWLRLHSAQAKEQHAGRIITTLNQCVGQLPRDKLQHVSSIGLSGQMHGVLFWKAKSGKIAATCLSSKCNDSLGFVLFLGF